MVDCFAPFPAGYSIEDTEAILNWWSNGGQGDFRLENGQRVPLSPAAAQPPPQIAPRRQVVIPPGGKGGKGPGQNPSAARIKAILAQLKTLQPGTPEHMKLTQEYYSLMQSQGKKIP